MPKIEEEPLEENFSAKSGKKFIGKNKQTKSRNHNIRVSNTEPKSFIIYEQLYKSVLNSKSKAKYNPDLERISVERINTFQTF